MKTAAFNIATLEDVNNILQLVNSAYRGESSRNGWTTEADLLDGIRTDKESLTAMMQIPDSVILKYVDEQQQLQGCVFLQKENDHLYLGMLTVNPYLQGKGIGKKLLQTSEEYAKKQNCNSIIMTVISLRGELINWYERHGFHNTGDKKPFPDDPRFGIPKQPLEFIVMEKQLPAW